MPIDGDTRLIKPSSEMDPFLVFAEMSLEGIVWVGKNDNIVYANPALREMLGYDQGELLGESLTVIMPVDQRQAHSEAFQRYKETGKKMMNWRRVELRGLTKDGRMPYLRVSFTEFEAGGEKYFAGSIRDITDLKLIEERLADFIEKTPDGVLIAGWDGGIVSINPAGVQILGYESVDEVKNLDTGMLYAEETIRHTFRKLIEEEGLVDDFRTEFMKKDGTHIHCSITATAQKNSREETVGYVGIFKDLTEEMKAMELELSLAKREAADEARKVVFRAILHDMAHPISALTLNAELLKQRLNAGNLEKAKDYADIVQKQLSLLHGTYGLLRKAIHLESGLAKFDFHDVSVSSVVELVGNIASGSRAVAREKGIDLYMRNEEIDPMHLVSIDEREFAEVILNLLSNSIKYTDKGSIILSVEQVDANLVIKCIDTGIGIPADQVESVFGLGFRGTNVERKPGTGVGLSVVKGVIDAHGGTIEVETNEGVGTVFTLKLPISSMQ